jgi:hypothetical protein
MLWFERQVVGRLISPTVDLHWRRQIEAYVDGALRAMPEHLRAGVTAESLVLGARPWLQRAIGRLDPSWLDQRVERWGASRIDVVRQYVRLLRSLVLFAESELVPEPRR